MLNRRHLLIQKKQWPRLDDSHSRNYLPSLGLIATRIVYEHTGPSWNGRSKTLSRVLFHCAMDMPVCIRQAHLALLVVMRMRMCERLQAALSPWLTNIIHRLRRQKTCLIQAK